VLTNKQIKLCVGCTLVLAFNANALEETNITQKSTKKTYELTDLVGAVQINLPSLDKEQIINKVDETISMGLAEFISLGLQKNPQLIQASSQFETAQARANVARAELLPNTSVRLAAGPEKSVSTLTAIPTTGTDSHHYATKSIRLTQPILNIPALKEFHSSRQNKDAALLRLQSMRESTALSATRATIDITVGRIILNFSDSQLEQLIKILNYLELRASAGASSQADLERARTRVLAARQSRIEQETNYKNAAFELMRITGVEPQSIYIPTLSQLPKLPEQKALLRQQIKDQNFDLLALKKDIAAQEDQITAEYAKYSPVLGFSLEKDTTQNVRGTNSAWTDTRALLVMTWNLSLGGREYFSAQQATYELRNREAKLDDELQKMTQATETDISLLQSTDLRIEAAQAEQNSANKVVESVEEQLKNGRIGSLLEALDASDRLLGARVRLTQTLGQQMKAHAQLLSRLGLLSNLPTTPKY
jgi:outer membrane protein